MKQIIYYYLALKILTKVVAGGYVFIMDHTSLPMAVFAVCGVMVLAGMVVLIRHYTGKAKLQDLLFFFGAEIIGTLFNLAFVGNVALVETTMFDMLVTGSLLDIILALGVILMVRHQKGGYVNMGKQQFAAGETAGKIQS